MATFDYDVVIVGSGFGGNAAALRADREGLPARCHGGSSEEPLASAGLPLVPAAELHMAASWSQLTIGDRTPPRCLLDGLAVGVVLWV
jgi:hypothetical protein